MAERPSRSLGSAGFTLLEMLVVVAVLGLIMLALTGGIRFGARAWEAMDRRQGAVAEVDAVASLFRRLVHAAQPEPLVGLGQEKSMFFLDGAADKLTFVTDMPEAVGSGVHYDVTFALAKGHLVLRWRPHVRKQDQSDATTYHETDLLQGVDELKFRYLTPNANDDPDRWGETWPQQGALPALINIHLRFVKDDRRKWVDIVAAPIVNAPSQ